MSIPADHVPIATVERAGLVTVQDLGRFGFTDVGVPTSGAWHRERHHLAVALVRDDMQDSNEPSPSLEILSTELSLAFHEPQVIAIVGSAFVRIDGHNAATDVAFLVHADTQLDIEHRGPGPAYVALSGWQPALTLGSAATDSFSRLGGPTADGSPIAPGQTLLGAPAIGTVTERIGSFLRAIQPAPSSLSMIAVDHDLADRFCGESWRVDASARSGIRLSGPRIHAPRPIPSMPVVPGAIQLAPDGTAIVLGPDGGLTGGYPIVGVVASAHLDRLADYSIGDELRFARTDPVSACEQFSAREQRLSSMIIRPAALN
jgi:allophanate hydrolase subunit 2